MNNQKMANQLTLLSQGFLLGLSLGFSCLATCAWIYGPVLASSKGDWRKGLVSIALLSAGRFLSYSLMGAASGAAGSLFSDLPLLKHILVIISYFVLSLYLLLTAFLRVRTQILRCPQKDYERYAGQPLIVGILTGINICPPFLLALARSFDSGGIWGGWLLFLGFFLSTSLYLLPLVALALLSHFRWFRLAGLAATTIVALWFLFLSGRMAYSLISVYK